MPKMGPLLMEGKGKRVYETDDPDAVIVYFKDEAMAFHGLKRGKILGKGEVNNTVCDHLFTLLEKNGIPTHYIRQIDARQSLVKHCEILPFTVTVRNRVAGSLAARTGLAMGTELDPVVIECNLKDDELEDPLINDTHIQAMHMATADEIRRIYDMALKINSVLTEYMKEINIELIDFKLEFGRYHGEIILADEITPDTARFWDSNTHEPLDIDRFRRDLGNVAEAYQDVLHRMMGD